MASNSKKGRRRTSFIWADKIALFAALAFFLILFFLWLLAFLTAGSAGASHILRSMGASGIELALFIAGTVWVVLRSIDFLARGLYRIFAESPKGKTMLPEKGLVRDGQQAMGTVEAPIFATAVAVAPPAGSAVLLATNQ